jgi:hypothetical protein
MGPWRGGVGAVVSTHNPCRVNRGPCTPVFYAGASFSSEGAAPFLLRIFSQSAAAAIDGFAQYTLRAFRPQAHLSRKIR